MTTSRATGSTSSIGSLSGVATGCWSTTGLEIGAEAIGIGCNTWGKAKNFKFSQEGQNGNFAEMGQAKICHFYKSRMTKRTSSLKSSREI